MVMRWRWRSFILQYNKHPTQKVHVYFLAGLPDITSFERSSNGMYQEVVIWETAEEASLRVIQTIREAEETVKELGAIPIFCTVAPMSLKTWNSKGLQQHKTTHLKHSQHYFGPSQDNPHYTYNMQITLENAVTHINQNIYSINHHNGMYTPKIAEFIFKRPLSCRIDVWSASVRGSLLCGIRMHVCISVSLYGLCICYAVSGMYEIEYPTP